MIPYLAMPKKIQRAIDQKVLRLAGSGLDEMERAEAVAEFGERMIARFREIDPSTAADQLLGIGLSVCRELTNRLAMAEAARPGTPSAKPS